MKRFILLLIFLLSTTANCAKALASEACEQLLRDPRLPLTEGYHNVQTVVTEETLFGKKVQVRRVDRDQLIQQRFLMADDLDGDESIFIGLTALGHVYIVSNIYRYDGSLVFEKPRLNMKSDLLNRGIVLKISDPEGVFQDQLIDYYKSNNKLPRTFNCISGACQVVMDATGTQLASNLSERFLPDQLIRKLILDGVTDKSGAKHEVEVFVIGNTKAQAVINAARKVVDSHIRLRPLRKVVKAIAKAKYDDFAAFISKLFSGQPQQPNP